MDSATKSAIRETLAHLVPCSGGKSVVLARPNLYLGRRENTDASAPLTQQTARCRLRLVSGWWEIERIDPTIDLRINSRPCEFGRVRPGDELTIGRARYRMEYQSPESASDVALSFLNSPSDTGEIAIDQLKASSGEIPVIDDGGGKPRPTDAPPPRTAPPRPSRPTLLTQRTADMPAQTGAPAAPRGVLAHLVPIGGGQDFPIHKPEVVVGREKTCDIPLRVKTVSSAHCKLQLIDGYWRVMDLNSRNGVRVDGVPCKEAWVFPECRLAIADQRFQLDYKPAGPRPIQDAVDTDNKKSLMDKIGVNERELDKILNRIGDQYPDETQNKRRDLSIDM